MKAQELINLLSEHPDWDVEIETETLITDIQEVFRDCFDLDQGQVFVIRANLEAGE
jgi:hypothetical protein